MCAIVSGDTILGFRNQTALEIYMAGRPLWVVIHGTNPNDKVRGGLDHEQHLLLCTSIPQDPQVQKKHWCSGSISLAIVIMFSRFNELGS